MKPAVHNFLHLKNLSTLFKTKQLEFLFYEQAQMPVKLRQVLGPIHLTSLGVGAMIGAGIFATIGTAAAGGAHHVGAGPAIVISFLLVSIACSFAALCYAEFASIAPISGSAYTYAYVSLGELAAWIIGWDLILEYAVGNIAVAISWSDYFQELIRIVGINFPPWLGTDYRSAAEAAAKLAKLQDPELFVVNFGSAALKQALAWELAPKVFGIPIIVNLPAIAIVAAVTWILIIGIKESAMFNLIMVILKCATILFFIIVGLFYIQPSNWHPFAPTGIKGITNAAAILFFAYIGFDAVSTAAEEASNPQKDIPLGIIASLIICTIVYIAVSLVLTGISPWYTLGSADPLAMVFSNKGLNWAAAIISVGALVATTSVLVAFQLGQPRIFFAMARDRLLPQWAAMIHPKFRTPYITTIITGVFVGIFAGITNIQEMVELTNIGTLFAFIIVAIGIIILRWYRPDLPRKFRTPFVPWLPLAAIGSCLFLMLQLPSITWIRFTIWLGLGLIIYFSYGRKHSKLAGKMNEII